MKLVLVFFSLLVGTAAAQDKFPQDFKWCVATSAHQIEGDNFASDWWAFEQIPGNIKNGDKSGKASHHWDRVEEDVDLLKSLNATHYRMSVEWAKIEPQEGVISEEAIEHYRRELALLNKKGIRPILTLHHFTHPKWFADHGGWEWKHAPEAFERFTRLVYEFAGPHVDTWVTINEPVIHVLNGYVTGHFAPGERRWIVDALPVFMGLLKAHAKSYHALHEMAGKKDHKIRVGMAHSVRTFDSWSRWSPIDKYIVKKADALWNWAIPKALETGRVKINVLWFVNINKKIEGLKGTQDFMGLNYYTGDLLQFALPEGIRVRTRSNVARNDMGWDIYPKGLLRLLRATHRRFPQHKILISENGIADALDRQRPEYLQTHLKAIQTALKEGVPVEGYCHWSFLDNFEWADGFYPRFGLFRVDYVTGERFRTKSADIFAEIAQRNSL